MRLLTTALATAALSAALGCSPKSPDAPALPQPTILTKTTAEGPSVACPVGGVRIDAGVDDGAPGGTARNGVLDPQEIDTTVRICGAAETLVKVTAEPAGIQCAAGGNRVDAGVDDGHGGGVPGNGVLETGEVQKTTYVCNGLSATCVPSAGAPALDLAVEVSSPTDGVAFAAGERPVLTMRFLDPCGGTASLGSVTTAELFLAGPRSGVTATKTASTLLNCITDRNAPDRQHHYVDLRAPHYADPGQANLAIAPDGLLTYTLAPVTTEPAGTYTATVWAKTADGAVQLLRTVDLQVGSGTVQADGFGGTGAASTCGRCHLGPASGRLQMAHSFPSAFAPLGNAALDAAPVVGCAACHNADGYSPNPLVRKVHGVHRGANQAAPGVDQGLGADPSLASYVDVHYPVEPGAEKDCASCHADDRWATAPTRLGCGTCHDAVRFAEGTVVPPRVVPTFPACSADADCISLGGFLTCNTAAGTCERSTHPVATDDSTCATCHPADTGISPIRARHEILERTRIRGLSIQGLSLSGGTGPGGAFLVGDVPTLDFAVEADGTTVPNLKTSSAFSATLVVGGPTTSLQRVLGPITMKSSGTLTYDPGTARYHYVAPAPFAATAQVPYNRDPAATIPATNVAGTYRLYFYVAESVSIGTTSTRDTATAILDFPFLANGPVRGRDVVTNAACNACHGELQVHGGSRRNVGGCVTCHTSGAEDRGLVGTRGRACSSDAQCPGFAAGWEACLTGSCQLTQDPTPGRSIALADLTHRIHAARRLGGYAESSSLVPGLVYVGASNMVFDLSDRLLSVDLRNCSVCHADTATSCSSSDACGVGQSCLSGRCRNTSWQAASAAACLGCHDTAAAFGHAALQTWLAVETCDTCHGPAATASVANAHRLADPTVPLHPREP